MVRLLFGLGIIALIGIQPGPVQAQVSPFYGKCRSAVMAQPGMTRGGGCTKECGAAIRRCVANKGRI